MDWTNYFDTNMFFNEPVAYIYFLLGSLILIINLIFIWKAFRQFKQTDTPIMREYSLRNYFLAMINLPLLPLGGYIGNVVRILSNFQYQIFTGESNIFFPLGLMFSLIFFLGYIPSILNSPFFQKRKTAWIRAFQGVVIVALIAVCVFNIRFILLGFLPVQFRENTQSFMRLFMIITSLLALFLILVATYFLVREYQSVSSQLKKAQLLIYIFYPLAMFGVILGVLLSTVVVVFVTTEIVLLISLIGYGCTNLATLALYYGMFTPKGFLVRMKVITQSPTTN